MNTTILTSMFADGFSQVFAHELRSLIVSRRRFAFVASDFFHLHEKTDRYFAHFLQMFARADISFEQAYVVDGRMTKEQAQAAVAEADVVWLSGGNTPVQHGDLCEYGLSTVLRDHPGVVIGMSAGSINLAQTAVCTCNCGHTQQQMYPGIGRVNISVEPHFTPDRVAEELLELSLRIPLYGLCDETVIIVKDDKMHCYGNVYLLNAGQVTQVSAEKTPR